MNRPPLNDLHAFATVARLRGFARAARELGLTPSALSHRMRGLEDRLGVRLLNRTTRAVAPTDAGARLLQRLGPALEGIDAALSEVETFRGVPAGPLRLNAARALVTRLLAPLAARFALAHPAVQIEIVGEDGLIDIVAGGFDAGVRYGEKLARDMVAVPIGPAQRFVVAAAPAYLARRGLPRHPREVTGHDCIRRRFPSGALYDWEFARGARTLAVAVEGALTLDDMAACAAAAEAGGGLAYLHADSCADALDAGRLIAVLEGWMPPAEQPYLYYPGRRLMPPPLRAFVDFVQAERRPVRKRV